MYKMLLSGVLEDEIDLKDSWMYAAAEKTPIICPGWYYVIFFAPMSLDLKSLR
jgi:hypothetical protein